MNRLNQLKALFLLVVFSMHTLVGLACSVGFIFGSTTGHHDNKITTTTKHKPHQHATTGSHAHDHGEVTSKHHSHDEAAPPHEHSSTGTHADNSEEEEDCCTDQVVKISLQDKALSNQYNQLAPPSVLLEFTLYAFFLISYHQDFSLQKLKPPKLRSWPLATHTDLRIAIQSFQI